MLHSRLPLTDGSSGIITNWDWDFGDGNTSTAQNPTHTYSTAGLYTVTLTVRGSEGSDATTTLLTVQDVANQTPTANAGPDQTVGVNTPVTLNGSGSSDPEGDPLTYGWSFGDNTSRRGEIVNHTYTSGGIFTVTLTVNDGYQDATDTIQITVESGVEGGVVPMRTTMAVPMRSTTARRSPTPTSAIATRMATAMPVSHPMRLLPPMWRWAMG